MLFSVKQRLYFWYELDGLLALHLFGMADRKRISRLDVN
jgi:hypothetical protein